MRSPAGATAGEVNSANVTHFDEKAAADFEREPGEQEDEQDEEDDDDDDDDEEEEEEEEEAKARTTLALPPV